MHLRIYGVDVPIHDSTNPDRRGVHVFTGVADGPHTELEGLAAEQVGAAVLTRHRRPAR